MALVLATAVSTAVLTGCASVRPDDVAESEEPERVRFALAWLPTQDAAAWYSAREQGWYEAEGIDIEIMRGFGSGDTAQRLATGEADFGIVDMAALVPMRLNEDLPLVAVAAVYAEPFHGVSFRADDGIEEPRDLEGRTIACSAGNANMLMFPAFAAATGIDADAIEWQLGDPGSITAAFTSGQADAACNPVPEQPLAEAQSDAELEHFQFVDHGVSVHSQMFVTTERMIETRPDLVERFLRASLGGLEFAIDNPEEAIDTLIAEEPDLDPDLMLEAWRLVLDQGLMTNEDTERHGLGHISPERMEATLETLTEAADIDRGDHAAEELHTTEFLP